MARLWLLALLLPLAPGRVCGSEEASEPFAMSPAPNITGTADVCETTYVTARQTALTCVQMAQLALQTVTEEKKLAVSEQQIEIYGNWTKQESLPMMNMKPRYL